MRVQGRQRRCQYAPGPGRQADARWEWCLEWSTVRNDAII